MTREEEILIEKVIWLIEDSYPDTDEWSHDTLVKRIKEDLAKRADELNRMFPAAHPVNLWHKASEELPEEDKPVIIAFRFSGEWIYDKGYYDDDEWRADSLTVLDIVEYWMPIPEIKED